MHSNDIAAKALKDFKKNAHECFESPAGKKVLAYLKEGYMDGSSVGKDSHATYYSLGQKELVQYLISFLNDDQDLYEVDIHRLID